MTGPRREWLPVAVWETLRTLKRKDFLVSVLLVPVLMVGVALVSLWFKRRDANREYRVAVVALDPSGAALESPLPPLERFEWVTPPPEERSADALRRAVEAKRYDGALVLQPDYARGGVTEVIVRRSGPAWKKKVEQHVHAEARRLRAAAAGLDDSALARLDAPLTTSEVVAVPGGKVSQMDRVAAIVLMLLLVFSLFVSTSYMAIGITGEKQARVTEVVVSAIRPQAWIDGKIVAYTLIGLAQAILWVAAAGLLVVLFRLPPPGGVSLGVLLPASGLFLLGMMLYVSLFSLILATIKDLQSTTKFQAYLYFLPFIPFFFMDAAIESPDAGWVMALSQIPFFSPFLIPTRLAVGGVQWWEPLLAMLLLVAAVHLLRRAAGAAFRIAMLMYGKEVSLPELARWAKQA